MKTDFDYSVMREIRENFGVVLKYGFNQFCGISLPNPCVKQRHRMPLVACVLILNFHQIKCFLFSLI